MITKEQLEALGKDPEFAKAVSTCKTEEEAVVVLKEYGIETDSWESFVKECQALAEQMEPVEGELDDDELANVQGGSKGWGVCFNIGIGWGDTCRVFGFAECLVKGLMFS